MNSMKTFNPEVACRVHDGLNDDTFDWQPEWAAHYREYSFDHTEGVVNWDGLETVLPQIQQQLRRRYSFQRPGYCARLGASVSSRCGDVDVDADFERHPLVGGPRTLTNPKGAPAQL